MLKNIERITVVSVLLAVFVCVSAAGEAPLVKKTVLKNGLTVLTMEIHTAPVVNFSVWYRVGSRNERSGITGISHALEHMAFKGSKNFPVTGESDVLIRRLGGAGNAGTSSDYTVYYETMPAGKLDLVIDIEADRMSNLLLRAEDFATERNVIMEERKMRTEDSPTGLFWEEIDAAAFKVHPYGWPIIGWMSDIESFDTKVMREYYESHYVPNNAIVVVAGDMDSNSVLKKITETFGKIERGPEPPPMRLVEPEQQVEKMIYYESDKTNLPYVVFAYHAPEVSHPDSPALEVAAEVMSGGRESRLNRELVETGLASSAETVHDTNQDPYLFYFEVELQPGGDPGGIEAILKRQIETMISEPVTDYELQRAKNRFAAGEIFSGESISGYSRMLGWFELTTGDYGSYDRYLDDIDKVTAEDVQRVAEKYFKPKNRTVGVLMPATGGQAAAPSRDDADRRLFAYREQSGPMDISDVRTSVEVDSDFPEIDFSSRVKQKVTDNGIKVVVYENPAFPTVHLHGVIRGAGSYGDTGGKYGLAQLVSRTIRRGTTGRTYEEINRELEYVGAEMGFVCGNETFVISGKYLKKDYRMGMDLLADVLMNPVFPEEGVEIERAIAVSSAEAQKKSNSMMAWHAYMSQVYEGHPYSNPTSGTVNGLKSVTLEDLKKFHADNFRPDRMQLVFAGDITLEEAVGVVEEFFGGWKAAGEQAFETPGLPKLEGVKRKLVEMPEKMQDVFYIGFPTLGPTDPDYDTFELMTNILAGTDLTSRLYKTVREKNGLVYYVYGFHLPKTGGATFQVSGGLAPENLEKAIGLVLDGIKEIQTQPLGEQELKDAKNFAIGSLLRSLETNDQVASMLSDYAYFGRPFEDIDKYPGMIEKINAGDIMRAAKKHLSTENYVIGVAGPAGAGK